MSVLHIDEIREANKIEHNKSINVCSELERTVYIWDFEENIRKLANIVTKETWNFPGERINGILSNYINRTYTKIIKECGEFAGRKEFGRIGSKFDMYKIPIVEVDQKTKEVPKFFVFGDYACWNTGLITPEYKVIYMVMAQQKDETKSFKWYFVGYYDDTFSPLVDQKILPERATYFTDISELIYDVRLPLRVNLNHILTNERNRSRIPAKILNDSNLSILFSGAIETAEKRIFANYREVVPQYYQDQIQFLIPIFLTNPDIPDLALCVSRKDGYYVGHTCIPMKDAYKNARMLGKLDHWLQNYRDLHHEEIMEDKLLQLKSMYSK